MSKSQVEVNIRYQPEQLRDTMKRLGFFLPLKVYVIAYRYDDMVKFANLIGRLPESVIYLNTFEKSKGLVGVTLVYLEGYQHATHWPDVRRGVVVMRDVVSVFVNNWQ